MTLERDIRIVVDGMGGDHAPTVNVRGAMAALEKDPELTVVLTGNRKVLLDELERAGTCESSRLSVVHADEEILMEDHAASAIRKKKSSSIHVGLRLVKSGEADAFISAGNSGAVMAAALLILGRHPSVERPAILIRLPTADGYVIILDAGANVDCRSVHLVQFAEMGSIYARVIEGISNPRVGLLANGSESHKGNELTRETHDILRRRPSLNYIGYIEGFDLFQGTTDVAVCDGFVGNIVLKATEGLAGTTMKWFRAQVKRDILGLAGMFLLQNVLKAFKGKFDYQPYGAAPLLGIRGMVLISHGSSSEVAITNGILSAKRGVVQNFSEVIREQLERTVKPKAIKKKQPELET